MQHQGLFFYSGKKMGSWNFKNKECLKVTICVAGKREFESLEIIRINELANAFVRLVSDLIAKGC